MSELERLEEKAARRRAVTTPWLLVSLLIYGLAMACIIQGYAGLMLWWGLSMVSMTTVIVLVVYRGLATRRCLVAANRIRAEKATDPGLAPGIPGV